MVPGLGTFGTLRLLRRMKSPQAIFRASASELEAAGLSRAQARSIASGCSFDDAVDQQQKMLNTGAQIDHLSRCPLSAALARNLRSAAAVVRLGNPELLARIPSAVVGTRRPTPYGMAAAERLSADLARAGLTIISGMARGIDTAAHQAALAEEGKPSLFSAAASTSYIPPTIARLYQEIAKRACCSRNFPWALRLIRKTSPSAIASSAAFRSVSSIVEGAQHSGSSITAKLAMDQGREVFAVPGNITSKMSWGPNLLIKEGAPNWSRNGPTSPTNCSARSAATWPPGASSETFRRLQAKSAAAPPRSPKPPEGACSASF